MSVALAVRAAAHTIWRALSEWSMRHAPDVLIIDAMRIAALGLAAYLLLGSAVVLCARWTRSVRLGNWCRRYRLPLSSALARGTLSIGLLAPGMPARGAVTGPAQEGRPVMRQLVTGPAQDNPPLMRRLGTGPAQDRPPMKPSFPPAHPRLHTPQTSPSPSSTTVHAAVSTTPPPVYLPPATPAAPLPPAAVPAATGAGATAGAAAQSWAVAPGDSFWSIAEIVLARQAGGAPTDPAIASYWRRLIALNRHLLADEHNPDLIYPGQVFTLAPVGAPAGG